jgi:hypothetical protein
MAGVAVSVNAQTLGTEQDEDKRDGRVQSLMDHA